MTNDLRSAYAALCLRSPVVQDVSAELRYVLLQRYVETSIRNGRLGIWTFVLMMFALAYDAPLRPRLAAMVAFVAIQAWRQRLAGRVRRDMSRTEPRSSRLHDAMVVLCTCAWPLSLFLLAPWLSPPNVFAVLYVSLVVLAVQSIGYFAALPMSTLLMACSTLPVVVFLLLQQTFVDAILAVATLICAGAVLAGVRNGHRTLLQALVAERDNAALVLELQRYRQQLEHENASLDSSLRDASAAAGRDALTGLPNRRHLATYAEPLAALVESGREEVAVCMIDIDHFKRINDGHGHAVGDEVLCAVAELLGTRLRDRDCLARFGGEEFVIVLRRCDIHRARRVAEALRHNVASAEIETTAGEVDVTVSFGVAQWAPGELLDGAISRADRCLYRAKQGGRDRVEIDIDDALLVAAIPTDLTYPASLH